MKFLVSQISLSRYLITRVLYTVPMLFGIIIVTFVIVHLAPGDPIFYIVGEYGISPEQMEALRTQLGLNDPIPVQLVKYLAQVIRGDLGYSFVYNMPVSTLITGKLVNTLILMLPAYSAASIIGVLLGVASSRRPYSKADNTITAFSVIGRALPIFWTGQLLLLLFAFQLGVFPIQGMVNLTTNLTGTDYLLDLLHHLFLPATALGFWQLALLSRLSRASMLETLGQDYIITARAKGLKEHIVLYRHALMNAMLPIITVIGLSFGLMLMGAVMTETVFNWPGMGRLTFDAILFRDYPVLTGIFIIASLFLVVVNFVTDALYAIIDPRVRYT